MKVRDANNAETFGQNCACNTQLNWPQGFLTKFVFSKTLECQLGGQHFSERYKHKPTIATSSFIEEVHI